MGRAPPPHARRRAEAGVWELFIPAVGVGARYQYGICGQDGTLLPLKADPMAFRQELPPGTRSIVQGLPDHAWTDHDWLEQRQQAHATAAPVSIYEVHLGSWRRGRDGTWLDWDTLADQLIAYVLDMGFTHVEFLPISEHPFSGSWGYQPIGPYAPTARFGPPDGFARMVDRCHQAGLGVIVDWVSGHFPSEAYGPARFDGTALYEHQDPRLSYHRDWNTLIYNYGRHEVGNFLAGNATWWLEQYHVDGLRVDAVASMLYLDYSRQPGEWVPNRHGGSENLEAIDFLQRLNRDITDHHPGAMTIAEESTASPRVSHPVEEGGLGFQYKWNMGWMHDTLKYMSEDPLHRRHHHHLMTFGLHYAFSENYVLPLSHDEVVHGKGSLIGRMPGDRWQRFANLRAYFGFMWTHPGKKPLFMGGEFAQEREWQHDFSLDWHLLEDPFHSGVQRLVRDLNHLYREVPALYSRDCAPDGFRRIDGGDVEHSVFSWCRFGSLDWQGHEPVVVVSNFTPVIRTRHRLGVPRPGRWSERLNTDAAGYGGSNVGNGGAVLAEPVPTHGFEHSVELILPPLATLVLVHGGGG